MVQSTVLFNLFKKVRKMAHRGRFEPAKIAILPITHTEATSRARTRAIAIIWLKRQQKGG